MDFIEKLPPASRLYSILVNVDHLSKQSLFIPTHNTITSPQLAQLFILHVSQHGVPSHVTSDRGMEFVSHSSQSLELHWTWSFTSLLDIILKVMDKPNEHQTLQSSESIATTQQTMVQTPVPLAEFAYNNRLSATTGITPFFANRVIHPKLMVHRSATLHPRGTHDFVTDLWMSYTNNSDHTLPMLNSIPNFCDLDEYGSEFKLGSKSARSNSSRQHDLPRSYP